MKVLDSSGVSLGCCVLEADTKKEARKVKKSICEAIEDINEEREEDEDDEL